MSFLGVSKQVFLISLKEAMVYRFNFLLSLITEPLMLLVSFSVWTAIFTSSGSDTIGGFTLQQMITYQVLTTLTAYMLESDVIDKTTEAVQEGTLTAWLLRPISFLHIQFMTIVGSKTLAVFLEVVPTVIIVGFLFGFDVLASMHFSYYLITLLIAIPALFFIKMFLGMLSFWVVKPGGFVWLYNMFSFFFYGTFVPLTVYPPFFQKISLVLPFQFVSAVPAQLASQGSYTLAGVTFSPTGIIFYGIAYVIVLGFIALFIWSRGIKRYSGVGT